MMSSRQQSEVEELSVYATVINKESSSVVFWRFNSSELRNSTWIGHSDVGTYFCLETTQIDKMNNIVAVFVALSCFVTWQSEARPQNVRFPEEKRFLPELRPSTLYIRPVFAFDNSVLTFDDVKIEEGEDVVGNEEEVKDVDEKEEEEESVSKVPRGPNRTPIKDPESAEEANGNVSESQNEHRHRTLQDIAHFAGSDFDLGPRLPVFGHHDVLITTEELRSRDRNEATFITPGKANAGLLPLSSEDPGALNLFPPLRAAIRIP